MNISQRNQEMLEHYIEAYTKNGNPNKQIKEKKFLPDGEKPERLFQVSTFYSVKIMDDEAVSIDNNRTSYTDEDLKKLAFYLIEKEKTNGVYESFIYEIAQLDDGTLIVFMDNTILEESITVLFKNTLMFSSIAFIFVFLLAFVLSKKIIKPLEESYHKQKQFISDAGHELKTPVSAIGTNLEMLSREIGDNRWIANIQYENNRMSAIILQLLELARMEQVCTPFEIINISRILMGEILAFEIIAFEHNLHMIYDDIDDTVFVHGNQEQLCQLTSILLDNAMEHSNKQGTVQISLRKKQNKVIFNVSNEGDAIPSKQQDFIFERFYRVDFSRTGDDHHYGLGLAIAKAIVQSHHGRISLSCEHGRITFSVQLPLHKN